MLPECGERAHLWHAVNPSGASRARRVPALRWEEPGVPGKAPVGQAGCGASPLGHTHARLARRVPGDSSRAADCRKGAWE